MRKSLLKFVQAMIALPLVLGTVLLPIQAQLVSAQSGFDLGLTTLAPSYTQAGKQITYELSLKNLTSQTITDIGVYNPIPSNTTYVSGGNFIASDNGVEFQLAGLAPNAVHKFTLVVQVDGGVAVDTLIENTGIEIYQYNIPGTKAEWYADGATTTVEAPGSLVAIYKNNSGRGFDVELDGFQFPNYGSADSYNATDDVGADDMFNLFGPGVCHSGTTANTCVLTGPAEKWRKARIDDMGFGHCGGLSAASLHIFDRIPFKGLVSPGDIQPGASNIIDLTFPEQTMENYTAAMMSAQSVDEHYDFEFSGTPVEIVNKLTADFKKADPVPYTISIFKMPGYKDGHSITAYGIEEVDASESRILVYDNNFPKDRKYITVDMVANTWRYTTAAIPGQSPDVYEGNATSESLLIYDNRSIDLPAGQFFNCPFCSSTTRNANASNASTQAVSAQQSSNLSIQYVGEGAILVINDEGQRTGDDPVSQTFVDEIPDTQIRIHRGGLGKEVPPTIVFPFSETDDTFYTVIVHGDTVSNTTAGSLNLIGSGFVMGVNDIELDPGEQFKFTLSPDGDHISFESTENMVAPELYIAHDPINDGDPSIIFDVEGVTVVPGEKVTLDLDEVNERIHFNHTGPEAEDFIVDMKHIWADGDVEDYNETIRLPADANAASIDFGAWDGLLHPPTYFDDVLQNPSVNHRLMLDGSTAVYDSSPQPNAPAGVYQVDAIFTNVTEVTLQDLQFVVSDLAEGSVLLNADGSPAGEGATISIPAAALGDDGLLHVNESVTVSFNIGLASEGMSEFTVDANGVPHDWIHEAPDLAGEANNASYVFAVNTIAGHQLYLPLLLK